VAAVVAAIITIGVRDEQQHERGDNGDGVVRAADDLDLRLHDIWGQRLDLLDRDGAVRHPVGDTVGVVAGDVVPAPDEPALAEPQTGAAEGYGYPSSDQGGIGVADDGAGQVVEAPAVPPPAAPGYPPEMVQAVCGQGFAWDCNGALAVSWCEMGRKWNPAAINPSSGTRGIFQIHPIHAPKWADFWESWMNPIRNAQMAFEIWAAQGWKPWACKPWGGVEW